jgi:Ca2+-binding RTX toxin-like protein
VRGGFLGDQDLNGDGIADTGFDKNFDGVIDPPDVAQIEFFDPFFSSPEEPLISGLFHNLVVDNGGSDNIRSTAPGSRQGDDFILSDVIVDTTVVNGVTQLVVSNVVNVGEDVIEVGGGNNFILDAGGDTTVRTLDGNDTIFTSYYAAATGVAGNDDINSGAGADFVNPGDGSDTVRGGAGPDQIELEFDGAIDTLTYGPGDVNLADFDQVAGFDGNGIDKFDLSALGATLPDLLLTTAFGPLLVGIDQNANDVFEAGVDIPVAFLLSVDGPLTLDNFIFDDPSIA